jgi:CheY-like chemotaxis protein
LSLASRPNPEEPFTILLADDNDINASFYTDYLERKGFRVVVARHGEQAIQLTQESHPDLILMDIQMPGLDGLEATRRIRASSDPHLAQVPIIALTALTMPGDAERCFEAGANEYLGKPVSLNKLIQTLTDWLSRPPG